MYYEYGGSLKRQQRKRRKRFSDSLSDETTNKTTHSGSDTDISVPDPSLATGSCNIDSEREEEHIDPTVSCSTPLRDILFPSDLSSSSSSKDDNENEIDKLLEGVNMSELSSFNLSSAHNKSADKMAATEDNHFTVQEDRVHVYPSGTFYGLPLTVQECFKKNRGIEQLYDWQNKCLSLPGVAAGNNLIYSLPTSGGKTLVAEILILQQIMLKYKDVLFILPYVSIVQEKVRELLPFAEELSFAVEEYASSKGRLPPVRKRKKNTIFIATIEKGNALINSLIEINRLDSIGLVVIDELHMIGGGQRGAVLESCIIKLLFTSVSVQLVGMSATLSNLHEIASFMRAELFTGNFRPVELNEYIKLGQSIYSIGRREGLTSGVEPIFKRRIVGSLNKVDPDQLVGLVSEVSPSSCLIFCSTKKNCENVALMISKGLPKSAKSTKEKERRMLIQQLRIEAAGLCPVLAQTLPYGIAYHHSGLTGDERKVIEEGYTSGILSVITCTSTLAAGVNLPARRVIIRQPYIGQDFISLSSYKQMAGRAGRSGLCDKGESIVILQPKDEARFLSVLSKPCDKCTSCLLLDNQQPFTSLILSLIALKILKSSSDISPFLQCTLLFSQDHDEASLKKHCNDIISSLTSSELISLREEEREGEKIQHYEITNIGRGVHKGCITVSDSSSVYKSLQTAQSNLILTNDLHLLTVVVPNSLIQSIKPDWKAYFEKVSRLSPDEERVADLYNISIGVLAGRYTGRNTKMTEGDMCVYIRFYVGLMLYSLLRASVSTDGVWVVASRFGCSRGYLQSVVQQTCSHSSCLVHFTEELPELWPFKLLLPPIVQKLSYSVSYNLLSLMEIPGMKQGRARQLVQAGIRSPLDLVEYSPSDLSKLIEHLYVGQAGKLIKSAQSLLAEKAELLEDEAYELLQKISLNKR
ncbi:PREDICTED: helicase POLQ-like [Amphimedon queenslandica]|uniref:Helicase POLQ-like n=1 Tax=Amphimedon queenslandica TaxID=400682 RepID=A0A1X7TTW6_AMPQE|nr:PREDICTED: helicase POLQ-like [Amphimedon queenslandica]|eukprot:XP_019857706.1 PREDICTED: helicase POLQ-like [Amphimedon queenslandica]